MNRPGFSTPTRRRRAAPVFPGDDAFAANIIASPLTVQTLHPQGGRESDFGKGRAACEPTQGRPADIHQARLRPRVDPEPAAGDFGRASRERGLYLPAASRSARRLDEGGIRGFCVGSGHATRRRGPVRRPREGFGGTSGGSGPRGAGRPARRARARQGDDARTEGKGRFAGESPADGAPAAAQGVRESGHEA